jgi:release factor glutamine methyltransferase
VTDVHLLLRQISERLAAAGVASPRAEARWLVQDAYELRSAELITAGELPAEVVEPLVVRRVAREPLQHILGTAAFRRVELAVGPGVFVPRPETELLVDAVLPALAAISDRAPVVVDLCSGSGALAVSLAREAPRADVYAVERDPEALAWLHHNADDVVIVAPGDVADPDLLTELTGRVDVVVSNPPYVPDGVAVSPEVRHDPPAAVFAGPDGLAVIPAVIGAAGRLLRGGGTVAIEHDDTHAAAVPDLLRADARWTDIGDHEDLAGRPRYVTATRRSAQ